jgi:hypothetical protein
MKFAAPNSSVAQRLLGSLADIAVKNARSAIGPLADGAFGLRFRGLKNG